LVRYHGTMKINTVTIDINADIGLGFEGENTTHEEKVAQRATSVNIACGLHGGDPAMMKRCVDLALKHDLVVGASIGIPNLMGLGDMGLGDMSLTPKKVSPKKSFVQVLYQIGALSAFAKAAGTSLQQVKLYGPLYDASIADHELASAVASALASVDSQLTVLAPAKSALLTAAEEAGLRAAVELPITEAFSRGEDADANAGSAESAAGQLAPAVLAGEIASISIDSGQDYAVMKLDELRRALHKAGISPAPLVTSASANLPDLPASEG